MATRPALVREPVTAPGPTALEQSLERALKKAPEPANDYKIEAGIILRVLRRWYGDETGAVLRAAVEQCK